MSSSSESSTASFAASQRQPKDYAAAFATLRSAYGLGGPSISISPKKSKAKAPAAAPAPSKDSYESALGALSSQFGCAAATPWKAPKGAATQSQAGVGAGGKEVVARVLPRALSAGPARRGGVPPAACRTSSHVPPSSCTSDACTSECRRPLCHLLINAPG
ncbi:hypothetical protein FB451DRAFT_1395377 [Mycena latifolia]|nr:hypothetical protein FB451DRAFT_1395377 [Mycena latifolia]